MKIELKRTPRCFDATDEHCIWDLIVNGHVLGTYYGGKEKKYLDKQKWATEQIKKRLPVLKRNIERLEIELFNLKKEQEDLLT